MPESYILTLSCTDVHGIVASVAGFLAEHHGFIVESAQFGDASTGRFFLRTEFTSGEHTPDEASFRQAFQEKVAARFGMDWQLHARSTKAQMVIMVSRYGHCLNDLLHRYRSGTLNVGIPAIISNHPDFRDLAEWHHIPFHYLPVSKENKAEQERRIIEILRESNTDMVVLARYMQILSPMLCEELAGRAINIHHSFLPSFKGAKPYTQAFDRGVKLIGATAHYVNTELDEGPIIDQEVARVDHTFRTNDLEAAGRDIECTVLARAVKYHTEHRVLVNGNKTVVFK
jgi:formyltetrahydrofolate deformylase